MTTVKPSALLCFLAAAATALAANAAGTNTVEKFAYRGTLANADGSAFASALPMQMTFRLYDRETGGTPLWGRTRPVRVETNGTFYVELDDDRGSPSDSNLPYGELAQALAACHGSCWIGLSPGDYSEMAPRQRLASVPCALHAVTADRITDLKTDYLSAPTVLADSATVGTLTATKSLHPPENTTLEMPNGGRFSSYVLVKMTGGIEGIQHFSFGNSGFGGGRSDGFVLASGAENIQGQGWAGAFMKAESGTPSDYFTNPQCVEEFFFGGMD